MTASHSLCCCLGSNRAHRWQTLAGRKGPVRRAGSQYHRARSERGSLALDLWKQTALCPSTCQVGILHVISAMSSLKRPVLASVSITAPPGGARRVLLNGFIVSCYLLKIFTLHSSQIELDRLQCRLLPAVAPDLILTPHRALILLRIDPEAEKKMPCAALSTIGCRLKPSTNICIHPYLFLFVALLLQSRAHIWPRVGTCVLHCGAHWS